MDKRDEDVLLDLLDFVGFGQIGTDTPVLLIENVIVDPAAAGRLQEWMVEEENKTPSRFENPAHFDDRLVHGTDVLKDQTGEHHIERRIVKREQRRFRPGVGRTSAALLGEADLRHGRIDADARGPEPHGDPGQLTVSCTHIEHSPGADEPLGRHRHDLLDVFHIGALGETLLPPGGVDLPELFAFRSHPPILPGDGERHWPDTGRRGPDRSAPFATGRSSRFRFSVQFFEHGVGDHVR